MRRAGSSRLKFWILPLAFFGILAAAPSLWLRPLGAALIHDDGPAKADIAVVLGGDRWGNRILKGAELVRDGYVPAVLVSGPLYYAAHECDLAIDFAVQRGYPREWFIAAPNDTLSTRDEAQCMLRELKKRNARKFLLVTSEYHTARSARIYRAEERKMGGGPEMRVIAAPDRYFRADSWWRSREGLKTAFMEWSKTVATALGK